MRPHVTDLVDKLSQGIMCRRLDPGIDGAAVSGLHQVGESEQRVRRVGPQLWAQPDKIVPGTFFLQELGEILDQEAPSLEGFFLLELSR